MNLDLNSVKSLVQMNLINLFHVIFVGPLLVAAGLKCKSGKNATLSSILLFLGLGVIVYHMYKLYKYNPNDIVVLGGVVVLGLGLVMLVGKYVL